jgi:raffinose/stachyose/melibiose transport system substrate-binding protein
MGKRHEGITMKRRAFLAAAAAGIAAPFLGGRAGAESFSGDLRVLGDAAKRAGLDGALTRFGAKHSGLRTRLNVASVDQLMATVRMQLSSGTAPDIVPVWPGNGVPLAVRQIAPAGYLADLTAQPFAKLAPSFAKDVIFVDEKLYWFANQPSVIGCLVNKRVWDKTGLPQPKTWSQFLDACQKLKDSGITPIALGNGTQWITQLINYALVATTVFAENPRFPEDMTAGKASFGKSGWVDAMTKYMELNKRGFFNPNPNGTSFEESQRLVASGRAAMAVHTAGTVAGMLATAGHRDFAMWPLPALDDAEKTQVAVGITNGYGVSATSKNKDAATAFLNFLAEPDSMADWAKVTSVPVFGQPEDQTDPIYVDIMKYVSAGKGALYMDNKWPSPRVQEAHFVGVQDLFAGKATIEQVLSRMDAAFRAA